jgi:hypothetical protein
VPAQIKVNPRQSVHVGAHDREKLTIRSYVVSIPCRMYSGICDAFLLRYGVPITCFLRITCLSHLSP